MIFFTETTERTFFFLTPKQRSKGEMTAGRQGQPRR
jgi:hypothetical protein